MRKALITTDDDYLASCLAITMTKLVIKSKRNLSKSYQQSSMDAILIICALLKEHHKSKSVKGKKLDKDSNQRMQLCLKILTNLKGLKELSAVQKILVDQGKAVFAKFLETHSKLVPSNSLREKQRLEQEGMMITQPDESIVYRQLKGKGKAINEFDITEEISGNANGQSNFMKEIQSDID